MEGYFLMPLDYQDRDASAPAYDTARGLTGAQCEAQAKSYRSVGDFRPDAKGGRPNGPGLFGAAGNELRAAIADLTNHRQQAETLADQVFGHEPQPVNDPGEKQAGIGNVVQEMSQLILQLQNEVARTGHQIRRLQKLVG
jgi:hypothetical protein